MNLEFCATSSKPNGRGNKFHKLARLFCGANYIEEEIWFRETKKEVAGMPIYESAKRGGKELDESATEILEDLIERYHSVEVVLMGKSDLLKEILSTSDEKGKNVGVRMLGPKKRLYYVLLGEDNCAMLIAYN